MPTASEFRSAASELQSVVEEMSSLGGSLDDLLQNSGMVGQFTARRTVEAAIDAAKGVVPNCFGALSGAIGDLEWRAQQCDAYAAELNRWRRAQQSGADPSPKPQKPYPWIDV